MSAFQRPISPDFEDGIDRKQLKQIRDRFLEIQSTRMTRTLELLPRKQSEILHLLPLLYHLNHPSLPGFVGHDCPSGLDCFAATEEQIRLAKSLHHSLSWHKNSKPSSRKLQSIFMMGSAGSIAFNRQSDIDLWLCHCPNLSNEEINKLDTKAKLIDEWAQKAGLELHTFLMSADKFRDSHKNYDNSVPSLDEESSGSAQHFLLLDEFYRTSTLIAGRYPLWWLIPSDHEKDYENWAQHLINKRFVPKEHVLDFGHCKTIPSNELIGAATWQLYKSLEAPYKSALKLFLAELYSSEGASQPTLSVEFKAKVYSDATKSDDIDPYISLYKRIEQYLSRKKMPQRLALARRCFYFKVGQRLTSLNSKVTWQQAAVKRLINSWAWGEKELHHLNLRSEWKTTDVINERRSLLKNLSASYRIVNKLARGNRVRSAISAKDLKLLGNKLNAQLEVKAGKVERINFGIAPNIFEANIDVLFEQGMWKAVDANGATIHEDTSPIALQCWLYINRVANRQTVFQLSDENTLPSDQSAFNFMSKSLYRELEPYFSKHLNMRQFETSARTEQLIMIINEGYRSKPSVDKHGNMRLSNQDNVLCYGNNKQNLVRSIDIVRVNSWQELTVERYEFGQPLVQAIMSWIKHCTERPSKSLNTSVLCFDAQWGGSLKSRLEALCKSISDTFFPSFSLRKGRFLIEIASEFHIIESDGKSLTHLSFDDFDSLVMFTKKIDDNTQDYWHVDEQSLSKHPLLKEALMLSQPAQDQVYIMNKGNFVDCCVHSKSGSIYELTLNTANSNHMTIEKIAHFFENACQGKVAIYESKPKGRKKLQHQSLKQSAYRQALKADLTELSIDISQKNNRTSGLAHVAQTYFGDVLNNRKSALATISYLDSNDAEEEWLPTPYFKPRDWPEGRPNLIELLEIYHQLSSNLTKRAN